MCDDTEDTSKFNPHEAPDGYIAVLARKGEGTCSSCTFTDKPCGSIACLASERVDGCSVYFKEVTISGIRIDAKNAPDGCYAITNPTPGSCKDCVGDTIPQFCEPSRCQLECRPDGIDVVFKELPSSAQDLPTKGADKYDDGKPPLELLDRYALEQTALVLAFGAKKYSAWNWTKGISYSRLIGAALRHIFAYMSGEDNDPESGLPHPAHAMCCLMFLLGMTQRHPELDNRPKD